MSQTSIEWTNAVWNPVVGCSKVSKGCDNCYAETVHRTRMDGRHGYPAFRPWSPENAAHNVTLMPHRLGEPLTWRKPRMVFVNSMSDLFHERLPYEYVREIFNVIRRCDGGTVAATGKQTPRHTFQILTKRPGRALELWRERKLGFTTWSSHVWLGVSIESWRFNWRADVLREIPAAVRFISAEPLLDTLYPANHPERHLDLTGIHWVIAGGESGPGYRHLNLDWVRELRDSCAPGFPKHGSPGVAFFFKQIGGRTPKAGGRELDGRTWDEYPQP